MKLELTAIPGVGKNMAAHLNALGIERVDDLKGKDPETLYAQECAMQGCTGWRWPGPKAGLRIPSSSNGGAGRIE